jgi:hypothetical protein
MTAFAENLNAVQMTGFPRASERTGTNRASETYPCLPHLLSKVSNLELFRERIGLNPLWIDRRR